MTSDRIGLTEKRRKELIEQQRQDNKDSHRAIAERLLFTDHIKIYLCPECLNRFPYKEFEEHFFNCRDTLQWDGYKFWKGGDK